MRNPVIAVIIAILIMGVVEASASRPSANDNKEIRRLCNETTSTRLPNGTRRVNPEAANRCYTQALDKLEPEMVVDGGSVYKEYRTDTPKRQTSTTTYKSKMTLVNGVYTNTTIVERQKEFDHQRKVLTLE